MKQTNNIIPQGYKDSPLGIIPEEWKVKKLGTILEPVNSFSFSREQMTDQPQKLRYIHYGDIHTNDEKDSVNLDNEELPFIFDGLIPKEKLESETFPLLKNGDILLADASEDYEGVGKSWEVLNIANKNIIAGLHTIALRDKENDIAIGYGRYIFRNPKSSKSLKRIAQGTKVYSISYNHISKLNILLPKLSEQQKIAEILSVWDEAIEKQTQLIAQLETRKRGLMQQLLTGKKRLKGFGGEWEKIKIKEIAKEYSIKNKGNKNLTVLSCTKYNGLLPSLEYFGRRVFAEDVSTYKVVPNGYFAYATNHIEEGSIGYQNLLDEALISPMYTVFKTNDTVNDSFIYSILKSHRLIYQYNARMEGSIDRRGGLRWESFSSIKVSLPSIEEQNAIVQILSSADNEINLAKQKLATLKEQKKGLMQQLLTGKKRVKI